VVPRVIADRYVIRRLLGQGGMAVVYLAEDRVHHRDVALKILRPELASAIGTERFLREIQVAARLSHAHVVPLFDSGTVGDSPFYVMPLVRGESLRQRLDRERQLPITEAITIAAEVADALSHAHALNVVHRDIKPENILLEDGHARVTDFGISTAVATASPERLTSTGITVGTPVYMSPEQAAGDRMLDSRSDIYSLGCVLYEMLGGEPPHGGPSPQVILARKATQAAPAIGALRDSVPLSLERVVATALARLPADRFSSAAEMARALRACLTATHEVTRARAVRWPVYVVAGLVAVLVLVLGLSLNGRMDRSAVPISRDAIAVFPFVAAGSGDPTDLRRGVVHLLNQALSGSGTLHSISAASVFAALPDDRDVALETARTIARRFGAGRFIMGTIVDFGGRIRLAAEIYSDASRPDTTALVEGPKDSVPGLVNLLATRLLSTELARKGALRTTGSVSSPEALRLYLDGLEASADGRWRVSVERFRAAVAVDSMLIPAWFQLASDAHWGAVDDSIARAALERASRFRDQLSARDRDLLELQHAMDSGAAWRSRVLGQQFVRKYQNDHEGWARTADILTQYHAILGIPSIEAELAYRRATALHREQSIWDIDRLAATLVRHDTVAFDSLWSRLSRGTLQHDFAWSVLAARPFFRVDRTGQERVIGEAPDRGGGFVSAAIVNVATVDIDGAIRLAQTLADPSRSADERLRAALWVAYLRAGGGQWRAADSALAAADSIDSSETLLHRAWLALLPDRMPSTTDLATLRRSLEHPTWTPGILPGKALIRREPRVVSDAIRRYLLGLIAARQGDSAIALGTAAELRQLQLPFDAGSLAPDLAMGIRAEVYRLSGQLHAAAASTDFNSVRIRFPSQFFSPFYSRARERFLYATLLDSLRHPDADRWLEATAVNQFLHDLPFRAPLLLRQARRLESLGRKSEARSAYGRVVELWRNGDPEVRAAREEAAAGVARNRP
jgi:tRNA A-37 threonylcarbamoyl transferase component Bud32